MDYTSGRNPGHSVRRMKAEMSDAARVPAKSLTAGRWAGTSVGRAEVTQRLGTDGGVECLPVK